MNMAFFVDSISVRKFIIFMYEKKKKNEDHKPDINRSPFVPFLLMINAIRYSLHVLRIMVSKLQQQGLFTRG